MMANGLPTIPYNLKNYYFMGVKNSPGRIKFFKAYSGIDVDMLFLNPLDEKVELLKAEGVVPIRETTFKEVYDDPHHPGKDEKSGYFFNIGNPDHFGIFCDIMEIPNPDALAKTLGLYGTKFTDSIKAHQGKHLART